MAIKRGISRRFGVRGPLLSAGLTGLLGIAAAGFENLPTISGDAFAIVARVFLGGGGESAPSSGGRRIVTAIGGSGIGRMEGGDFVLGPGVVGAVTPSAANLDGAHAFPVPYMPTRGHTAITFTGLPTRATVRIFTLSGELVKELVKNESASDRLAWSPVENERGQQIASGVYIFSIVSGDGQVKNGKLMVIK